MLNVVVLNEQKIECDKFVMEVEDESMALFKAEKLFLSNNPKYDLLDAGMFIGAKSRDLTVLNNDNGLEEYYEIKIVG